MPTFESNAKQHSPELDGIRGLAILGVLCTHGVARSGIFVGAGEQVGDAALRYVMVPGWGGVDLFFALSGFLITGILLRSKTAENYFSTFYARRILRIFPIYYVVLVSSLIVAHFSSEFAATLPHPALWKVSFFFYLQNWPVFWHGQKVMTGPWDPYWSLAVEEQFYLIWPVIIMRFREKTVAQICFIGLVCALPLRLVLLDLYFGRSFGLAQITTSRVDALFMGAACALYTYRYKRPVPMRWIIASASAGTIIIAYIAIFHHQQIAATAGWMTTFGITGFALLSGALVAVSQHHFRPINQLLTMNWLSKMGKYSYGIYVYHIFLFHSVRRLGNRVGLWGHLSVAEQIAVLFLEVGAAYFIAKLSYELYESKFLRMKNRFEPRYAVEQRTS